MLAMGVDKRVLEAGRMSQQLLQETAEACGGTVVQGFENIHQVFKEYSKPPAQQVDAVLNGGVPPVIVAWGWACSNSVCTCLLGLGLASFGAALLVFARASWG
jgi:hypothetical protein